MKIYRKSRQERFREAPKFLIICILGATMVSMPTIIYQASKLWLIAWIFPLIIVVQILKDTKKLKKELLNKGG